MITRVSGESAIGDEASAVCGVNAIGDEASAVCGVSAICGVSTICGEASDGGEAITFAACCREDWVSQCLVREQSCPLTSSFWNKFHPSTRECLKHAVTYA